MKMRTVFPFILLQLISIAVLLELLVRITNAMYPLEKPSHLRDIVANEWLEGKDWSDGENRLYILKPNSQGKTYGHSVQANRWGFRGRDFLERDQEGWDTFRILVLGDSLTMGWGVAEEDRYTNVIETKLRERYSDINIEVINLGIHGYETIQEEKILQRMWSIIKPNLTIIGFTQNDPNISYKYYLPYKMPIPERSRFLMDKSLTFRLVESWYDELYRWTKKIPSHAQEVNLAFEKDSSSWKLFERSVRHIADFVAGRTNQRPLLMYLADVEGEKNKGHYWMVRDTFEKNGFIWVEMAAGHHYIPVSRFEGHPNEENHKYYAQALVDTIVRLNLIFERKELVRD